MRLLVALALCALLAACGDAQPSEPTLTSSAELAARMRERFDEQLGDARAFTVVVGGFAVTHTVAADTGAAQRVAVSIAPTDSASADPLVQALVTGYLPNVPLLTEGLAGAPLQGPFERDGHRVYAVEAGGAAGLDSTTAGGAALRVYVDAATFSVREVYRTVRLDSVPRPLTSRILYDDFRTEDGVTLPWRLRVVQEGLDQILDRDAVMVESGTLGLQRAQLQAAAPSPERDARLAALERRLRLLTHGVEEAAAVVRRVTVTPRD